MPSFVGCHHPRKEGPKKTHRQHPASVSDADAERWLDVAVPTHLTLMALMSTERDVPRLLSKFRIHRLQLLNSLLARAVTETHDHLGVFSRGYFEVLYISGLRC